MADFERYLPKDNNKMANWVARQQRHLSEDDFDQWVASRLDVQAYLGRQGRLSDGERDLERIFNQYGRKAMAPALEKAAAFLAEKEKSDVPVSSGTFRQSIGTLKPKFYTNGATFCGYTAAGVRRGYARVVDVVTTKNGKFRRKRRSKAKSVAVSKTKMENPSFVGMILERGRRGFKVKAGTRGLFIRSATFCGYRAAVGAVAGRDILGGARSLMSQAQRIYAEEFSKRMSELIDSARV